MGRDFGWGVVRSYWIGLNADCMDGLDIGVREPLAGTFSAILRMSSMKPRPRCDCTTAVCCCTKAPSIVVAVCVCCCALGPRPPRKSWPSGLLLSLFVLPPRPPLRELRVGLLWIAFGAEWWRGSEDSPRTMPLNQRPTEEALLDRLLFAVAAAGFTGEVAGGSERSSGEVTTIATADNLKLAVVGAAPPLPAGCWETSGCARASALVRPRPLSLLHNKEIECPRNYDARS